MTPSAYPFVRGTNRATTVLVRYFPCGHEAIGATLFPRPLRSPGNNWPSADQTAVGTGRRRFALVLQSPRFAMRAPRVTASERKTGRQFAYGAGALFVLLLVLLAFAM
jgi:hypothetical protein